MEYSFNATEQNLVIAEVHGNNLNPTDVVRQLGDELMSRLHAHGIVVLRGLRVKDGDEFRRLLNNGLGWTEAQYPRKRWLNWNSKVSAPVSRANRPRGVTQQLDSLCLQTRFVQGPHVEGGLHQQRAGHLAMLCRKASGSDAPHGFVDLEKLFMELPEPDRQKYAGCRNVFSVRTCRLGFLENLVLSVASRLTGYARRLGHRRYEISLPPTPFVTRHPVSGQPCLQPWALCRNTSGSAYRAACEIFSGRSINAPDATASRSSVVWKLFDYTEKRVAWDEDEKLRLFKALYQKSFSFFWKENDILLLDNIRFGHFRMDGPVAQRQLVQVQCNPVHIREYRSGFNLLRV